MQINAQHFATRCEICHQSDLFDPQINLCQRCKTVFSQEPKQDIEQLKNALKTLTLHIDTIRDSFQRQQKDSFEKFFVIEKLLTNISNKILFEIDSSETKFNKVLPFFNFLLITILSMISVILIIFICLKILGLL